MMKLFDIRRKSEDEIDEISEDLACTPPEIREAAKDASFDLLPTKARECTNGTFVYLGKSGDSAPGPLPPARRQFFFFF